ncbi:MAG: cyclase family protein [Acidobacteriota bacterium]
MIYDISPPVSSELGVWPGDTPLNREVLRDMKAGANLTLSTLRATVHLGAHADAPSHYGADAPAIDERSLDFYLGPCEVVEVQVGRKETITPRHFSGIPACERILFRTGTFPDPKRFPEDFAAVSPELVDQLHRQGVRLVGIDTPSLDLFASGDLPAHLACLRNDMAILEGIVLDGVPEGIYELIALPLRLVGFDASPVRAILREIPETDPPP